MESHRATDRHSGYDRAGFLPKRLYGNCLASEGWFRWQTQEETAGRVAVHRKSQRKRNPGHPLRVRSSDGIRFDIAPLRRCRIAIHPVWPFCLFETLCARPGTGRRSRARTRRCAGRDSGCYCAAGATPRQARHPSYSDEPNRVAPGDSATQIVRQNSPQNSFFTHRLPPLYE